LLSRLPSVLVPLDCRLRGEESAGYMYNVLRSHGMPCCFRSRVLQISSQKQTPRYAGHVSHQYRIINRCPSHRSRFCCFGSTTDSQVVNSAISVSTIGSSSPGLAPSNSADTILVQPTQQFPGRAACALYIAYPHTVSLAQKLNAAQSSIQSLKV